MIGISIRGMGETILSQNAGGPQLKAFARLAVTPLDEIIHKWIAEETVVRKTELIDVVQGLMRMMALEIVDVALKASNMGKEKRTLEVFLDILRDTAKGTMEQQVHMLTTVEADMRKKIPDAVNHLVQMGGESALKALIIEIENSKKPIVEIAENIPDLSTAERDAGMAIRYVHVEKKDDKAN